MTTTAVFVEILVGGVEALIWVVLLALAIVQPSKADAAALLDHKEWAAPIVPVLLALAYALGIVVDRLADSLFKPLIPVAAKEASLRFTVLARGDKVTDFLEYIRSRLRVARVTALNLAIVALTAPICLHLCTTASLYQILATSVVLEVLMFASLYTMWRIGDTYKRRLVEASELPPAAKKS